MKIKKILRLMSVVEERKTPVDMYKPYQYFSSSKGEWINVGDMDLIHFIRVAYKYVPEHVMQCNHETLDEVSNEQ